MTDDGNQQEGNAGQVDTTTGSTTDPTTEGGQSANGITTNTPSTPETPSTVPEDNLISKLLEQSTPASAPTPELDAMPFVDASNDATFVKTQVTNQLQQIDNDIASTLSNLSSKASPKDPTSIVSKLNALNAQKEIMAKAKISINPEDKNMANVISREVPFPKTYLRCSLIPIDINENYYSEAAFLNTNPLQFLNQLQDFALLRSKDIKGFTLAQNNLDTATQSIREASKTAEKESTKRNRDTKITTADGGELDTEEEMSRPEKDVLYEQNMLLEIDKDRQMAADIHYSIISAAIHFHIYLQNMYDQYGHTMFIKAKQRIQDLIYPYEGHDPAYNLNEEKRKLIGLKSFFGIFAEITGFLDSQEWHEFKTKIDAAVTNVIGNINGSAVGTPVVGTESLDTSATKEMAVNKVRKGKRGLYSTRAFAGLSPLTSHPSPTKTVFLINENSARKRIYLTAPARAPLEISASYLSRLETWLNNTVYPTYSNLEKDKTKLTNDLKTAANNLTTATTAKSSLEKDIAKLNNDLKAERSKNLELAGVEKELNGKKEELRKKEEQISQLESKLQTTEERIRAEVFAELTSTKTNIQELGSIDIENVDNYIENFASLQKIILDYINAGLENIKHAETLGTEIKYDVSKNVFLSASDEIKTDIVSKMAAIRESVDKYLSRFYTSKDLLKPMFFLEFVYRHDTFLGNTGVGNIMHTFTLGPLEKQEIRVKTSETTREARESSSTIFDTASESAQKEFETEIGAEMNSSSSTSVDVELYTKASLSVGVEAKGGMPGVASVGASMDASIEGGAKTNTNSTHEQAAKNTQNASQKHVSQRQSQRDSTVSEMSQSEKETTKEEGYIRTIENPNPDVAMNYTFRQIIQEYISTIALVDIKMLFSNGVVVKEAPASEVNNLIATYIKPELTSVHETIRDIVRRSCKVRDYQDRMINMLDSDENGVFRLRKDSYAKMLEDFGSEFDALSEAPIFDLFKNIYGPLIHFWKFSLIQPGAVMIPEISYGSALGPQAREEFQMKVDNWKNENQSIALQNESIQVKNELMREFLKMLPTIKDEKLRVDAIFKLVNQSTEIADKLTILRLMSEGGADVSSIKKSLKLTP